MAEARGCWLVGVCGAGCKERATAMVRPGGWSWLAVWWCVGVVRLAVEVGEAGL